MLVDYLPFMLNTMLTVITVELWVETVWSLLVTGWLEMLMLTGEGVGMALAHDLSSLLSTVTFYSPVITPHTHNIQSRNEQIFTNYQWLQISWNN